MKKIEFNFDQVNGMSHIYAVHVDSIRDVSINPLTGLARISLTSYEDVVEIPVYSQADTSYSERQQTEEGVDRYDVAIGVFLPRHANPQIVQILERGEWMVIHQDANGDILASGTEEIPLLFASGRQTGGNTATGNYGEFTAVEPEPSLNVDPDGFYIE